MCNTSGYINTNHKDVEKIVLKADNYFNSYEEYTLV